MMRRMKTGALLVAVLGLLLVGCGEPAKTAGAVTPD